MDLLTSHCVIKGYQHASWDVQELAVDLEDFCRSCKIFFQTVSGRSKQHQSSAHANDVLLTLEDVGNVDLDAYVLVLFGFHDFCEQPAAAGALVLRA